MNTRRFNIKELGYTVGQRLDSDSAHADDKDKGYISETADDLFDELRQALELRPDFAAMYDAFNAVFVRFLNANTEFTRMTLAGTFAKTDYLLKDRHAPRALRAAVNATRVRLRRRAETDNATLKASHIQDYTVISRFIRLIYSNEADEATDSKSGSINSKLGLKPEGQPNDAGSTVIINNSEFRTKPPAAPPAALRVIVNRWDDDFIYAETADGGESEMRICYSSGNKVYAYDWTYLRDMLYEGAQLNIIRPREEHGTVYPELTIFEPDNLVDISAVARCFETYAESPLLHLLKRLEPPSCSEAIMLGNFAGQLLDEATQAGGERPTYAESATAFFRNNAMRLLTTDIGPSFHTDAKEQKHNIGYAMRTMLPEAVERFDAGNGFVEPSFFSEMLGLQGRMDYIQLDQGVIIEQKSGKGAFPYDGFAKPRHREEHYVQLLLYMLIFRYNYRDTYERNNREMFAFLLYSKYRESLLGLGFAPELVFRAVKIRNGIAWLESLCTCDGGFRLLERLSADSLNMKHAAGRLWEEYQKPKLEALLSPVREAPELERAYYFRFLTFIANEHIMSKLGNKTKDGSGFASVWHCSLQEKLQAGNIYDRLTLTATEGATAGRVDTVTLRFAPERADSMANFREGDIVILYPYDDGSEPDARMHMVFRSTIVSITTDGIRLSLRNAQTGEGVFRRCKDSLWAVEHDFFESSYSSLYSGMHSFLSAPESRRDLLLFRRRPETDGSVRLKGDYGNFNDMALRVKQARDMFIIIGPPGTGKTSFGMLNTVKEELLEEGSTVLVLSYTNRAVDEICAKLDEAGIDFIRIGGRFSCDSAYRDHLFDTKVEQCRSIGDVRALISSARVLVGTTSAFNGNISLFGIKQFSLAIIDEASQILEPHLIGLLSAASGGAPAIRKFVMIGDHKQLPAVVQQGADISKVTDPLLNAIDLTDCRLSLFERLLRRYHDDSAVVFMLNRQGRMHPDIALFPNDNFYGGRLCAVPLGHQRETLPESVGAPDGIEQLLRTRRTAFVDAALPESVASDKVNPVEAEMIAATVARIYRIERDRFSPTETVGVIMPYRGQIATVRRCIAAYGIAGLDAITIDTVERYQGSQRRYIIYGFTISRNYQFRFLADNVFTDFDGTTTDRKLNVAMTRAEEHLILFGNAALLSRNTIFNRLIQQLKADGCFISVGLKAWLTGKFTLPPRR